MTQALFALVLSMLPLSSMAAMNSIRCSFTEPFITTIFDPDNGNFYVYDSVLGQARTAPKHYIRQTSSGNMELVSPNGIVVQRMRHTGRGSDGMSDKKYPYEVLWYHHATPLSGGCETRTERARD